MGFYEILITDLWGATATQFFGKWALALNLMGKDVLPPPAAILTDDVVPYFKFSYIKLGACARAWGGYKVNPNQV